jgi:hypothetical protein
MMGGGTAWNMWSIYSNKYRYITLHLVGYTWIQLTMHGSMNVQKKKKNKLYTPLVGMGILQQPTTWQ